MNKFPFQLIDLTDTVRPEIPYWTGACGFSYQVVHDYDQSATPTKFHALRFELASGIGTHMDAPAHCIPGGATISELPLEALLAPCVVIDVSDRADERYSLTAEDVARFETQFGRIPVGSFALVRTGWDRFWHEPKRYHNEHRFPSIGIDAAEMLVSRGITGIGIDRLSPDRPESGFPVHQLILESGKYIVENIAHSEKLPPTGAYLLALPMKIGGATEAPIRLVGLVESTQRK